MNAEIDGERLTDDQLLFEHVLLLVGGSETTRNAIAGGLEMLMEHPEQLEWLREHPEGLDNAVWEILRWTTPFIAFARTACRDVELHGQTIEEGQMICMLYPAANRDPRRFDDPDRFDVRREFPNRPVSFGYGAHYCLGAALAQKEVRVVLEEVLKRLPVFRRKPGTKTEYIESSFIRGIKHLPVLAQIAEAAE